MHKSKRGEITRLTGESEDELERCCVDCGRRFRVGKERCKIAYVSACTVPCMSLGVRNVTKDPRQRCLWKIYSDSIVYGTQQHFDFFNNGILEACSSDLDYSKSLSDMSGYRFVLNHRLGNP